MKFYQEFKKEKVNKYSSKLLNFSYNNKKSLVNKNSDLDKFP